MRYFSVGITATRTGLSSPQKLWVEDFIYNNNVENLHHGDCIGGDAEVAILFAEKGTKIIAHPGNISKYRAYCTVNDLVYPWEENLVRNKTIVDSSEMLLAFPLSNKQATRSGTWFTIRYARERKIPTLVIGPDGLEINGD